MMRYTYLGDKWTNKTLIGLQCNPVLRQDGKCIVSIQMATALVKDKNGNQYVVARRRLRLNNKLKQLDLF